MAEAVYFLRKAQVGIEATAGTAVPATAQLVGEAVFTPIKKREFEDFPRGVRAPVTGGGFVTSQGSAFKFKTNLSWEEVLLPLLTGIQSVSPSGSGPYTYTFDPTLTAAASIKTATIEYVVEDGSTKHYERECAYNFTTEFEIELAGDEPAQLSFEMMGRAEQTSTMTTSLAPSTGRTPIPSNLFKIWIDDTGAGLGGTVKTGTLRKAKITVKTGLTPKATIDGLADLDQTGINTGTLTAEIELTLEHNANAATEVGKWRTGSLRFIRLKADNGAAAGANKALTIDMCVKYTEDPDFSEDDGIELVTLKGELEYDSTWAKAIKFIDICGLAAPLT